MERQGTYLACIQGQLLAAANDEDRNMTQSLVDDLTALYERCAEFVRQSRFEQYQLADLSTISFLNLMIVYHVSTH